MIQKPPLIKLRNLKELQCSQKLKAEAVEEPLKTPVKRKKPALRKATTSVTKKKVTLATVECNTPNAGLAVPPPQPPTTGKRTKSTAKEPPPNQLRINAFFKTCEKTYKIEPPKEEPTPFRKAATEVKKIESQKKSTTNGKARTKLTGRKRLFVEEDEVDNVEPPKSKKSPGKEKVQKMQCKTNDECIDLISESEDEQEKQQEIVADVEPKKELISPINGNKTVKQEIQFNSNSNSTMNNEEASATTRVSGDANSNPTTSSSSRPKVFDSGTSGAAKYLLTTPPRSTSSNSSAKTPSTSKRKQPKPCPPYKVIEGTNFAVDAFQFGYIEGVDFYFLTHFHADHYIGLTKKFAKPLYMSSITARLVRTFIPIDEQYIHELNLNEPVVVNDIEITALDANHCPGAIMLLFKNKKTQKCILHTGDFRAWHGMEEEPAFWNNTIDTIYLDTTYLSQKYAFCTQYESIDRAKLVIQDFQTKHSDKKILYVCGSYVIGKEKFWSSLAEQFGLRVWTEENRSKALEAIGDEQFNSVLVKHPKEADMHVITMGKLSYLNLVDYFSMYEEQYDILLAIRPSGWEKDSRPQYRGKINIVGIEYSEHSSYEEMKRFVRFLKPKNVISTVPVGRDLMIAGKVPEKWYQYEKLQTSTNYQPRIDQFLGRGTPQRKALLLRKAKTNCDDLEHFVSPLKKPSEINNNTKSNGDDGGGEVIELISESASAYEFDPPLTLNKIKKENVVINGNIKQEKVTPKKVSEKNTKCASTNEIDAPITLNKNKKENCGVNGNIKKEKVTPKKVLKKKVNSPRIVVEKKNSTKKIEDKQTSEVLLSENLKDGESCSLFVTNSSDFFESPAPKTRCSRRIVSNSSSEEIRVSQKRRPAASRKQKTLQTIEENATGEEEVVSKQDTKSEKPTETKENDDYLFEGPSTSKEAARRNPLLKSNTTSASSHEGDAVSNKKPYQITKQPCEKSNRNDVIPASQTTLDLENTPRPLRDKFKYLSLPDMIPASQTSRDLEMTPRPLRNKAAWRQLNEIIPASQTTADLASTPRPIRNKRKNANTKSTEADTTNSASPPKRISTSSTDTSTGGKQHDVGYNFNATPPQNSVFNESQVLTQLPNNEEEILDIYNTSQLISKVVKTLADHQPDKSIDHIPPELLSDPDAADDWLD
ncbi:DNA cross-link repair protein snm1 [Musca autumnalis]|uniref:DNA cross-link repair protein snm1 n=1 Tax=Musca autumnalis TaxID=221902 RepID=UPI003CF08E7D